MEGSYASPVRGRLTISVRRSRERGSAQHHWGGGCCLARLRKRCHLRYHHDRFVYSCEVGSILEIGSGSSEEEVVGLLWEPGGRQCWPDTFSVTWLDFTSWHSSGEHPKPGKTGRYSPCSVLWLCGVCKVKERSKGNVRYLVISWDTGKAGLGLYMGELIVLSSMYKTLGLISSTA